jgi:hypothetical protein
MPAPKRSTTRRTTSSRRRTAAKEPAALKRLNKSLDSADSALTALSKDVGAGAGDLHKNVSRLLRDARRDSGKLGKAVLKDLQQLQKALAETSGRATSRARATRRSTAKRATAKRATAKRAPAKRATAKRATAKRATTRRATARRSAAKSSS